MLREVLILNLILSPFVVLKRRDKGKQITDSNLELAGGLITSLRNDANLDLSMDEEYEDLRAELLAYHTALASLAEDSAKTVDSNIMATSQPSSAFLDTRRSMKTTPCWNKGGICIHHKLCQGHNYLTEIAGCKNNLEVCCLSWNKLRSRDLRDKGINNIMFPWSHGEEIGGKGLLDSKDKRRETKIENNKPQALQVFEVVELEKKHEKEIERTNGRQRLKNLSDDRKYETKPKSHLLFMFNPQSLTI